MKYSLLIDTSYKTLSVGIAFEDKIIYNYQEEMFQQQSEMLGKKVKDAFKAVGKSPTDLSCIIVTSGPGSYTGIRLGLSFCKVLAFLLKIDLITISSLQTICGTTPNALALINARRERAYCGYYNSNNPSFEKIMTIEEINAFLSANPSVNVLGDVHLLDLKPQIIPIIENMLEISKTKEPVTNIHEVRGEYLC
jgi:tRNA threonylcarbamoyl adenosine modification protein YeaZ